MAEGLGPVTRCIRSAPGAIGLVVIVTNDYSTAAKLTELPGASQDGHTLCRAFAGLNFAVCRQENVNGHNLGDIIHEISRLSYDLVKSYHCIIFIFAGHGRVGDHLVMQDSTPVSMHQSIIEPLLAKNATEIGGIPKIFLIDACRGEATTKMALVPRSCDQEVKPRGGSLIDMGKVPEEGNFLLAYSTMPKHKAYESCTMGGVWFTALSEVIAERENGLNIQVVLTKANELISKNYQNNTFLKPQQPECLSRLNKVVYLDPNRKYYASSII